METRKVAIACQGGGIHGAFTCGVLSAILKAKEDEQKGKLPAGAKRSFEIFGLSGTSAGALNAFMVWCGLLAKEGISARFAEARRIANNLSDTFQVQKSGEQGMNTLAKQCYRLQEHGLIVKPPRPAYFHDFPISALGQWSTTENALVPGVDLGEIRPEFYDFQALLHTCVQTVNKWIDRLQSLIKKYPNDPALQTFAEYKPLNVYLITMSKEKSVVLGVGSNFDRSPEFVTAMRQHGEARAASFLTMWLADSNDLLERPQGDAVDAIGVA